jgi:hypothetical protein
MGGRGFVFSNAAFRLSIPSTQPSFQKVDDDKIE